MNSFNLMKTIKHNAEIKLFRVVFLVPVCMIFLFTGVFAQTKNPTAKPATATKQTAAKSLPKVTQIDDAKIKNLLKPNAKPLLVNFWATWCVPCREEFPDLVKIDADYRGKIDFITISLDFVEDINTTVPEFLSEMKAEMPSYLLVSEDESALISSITKDWNGGLPFTILYNAKGDMVYFHQGKVKPETLKAEIDKTLVSRTQIVDLPVLPRNSGETYAKGKIDAQKDIASGKFIVRRYGLTPGISPESLAELKTKFGIEIKDHGCLVSSDFIEYIKGYNEISAAVIKQKFNLEF